MDYKYCYIIDFASVMIYCIELQDAEKKPKDFKNTEDMIRYYGFKPCYSHWLFSNEKLDINYINSPLK